MKTRRTNKQGISLIVLVITIIVMIILAAAIILSLSSNGLIDRANEAVDETDVKQVKTLANTLWAEAYLEKREDSSVDIDTYVRTKLSENNIDVDKYIVDITNKGVEVEAKSPLLEKWKESVSTITNDGVPIPKGYVASPYEGEGKKSGGLVIYKLTPEEIEDGVTELPEESYETSLTTRNQYVWVPIAKEEFKTKFVRSAFGYEEDVVYAPGGTTTTIYGIKVVNMPENENDIFEFIVDETSNMPNTEINKQIYGDETAIQIEEMYKSVKEHEGFYIARYEAAAKDENGVMTAQSVKGAIPFNMNGYQMLDYVELMQTVIKNETTSSLYGAQRFPLTGVQWDATVQWFLDSKAIDGGEKPDNYGNLSLVTYNKNELDANAKMVLFEYDTNGMLKYSNITYNENEQADVVLLSTGAVKNGKINNIYDMMGNFDEITTEKAGTIARGGQHPRIWVEGLEEFNNTLYYLASRGRTYISGLTMYLSTRETMYIK